MEDITASDMRVCVAAGRDIRQYIDPLISAAEREELEDFIEKYEKVKKAFKEMEDVAEDLKEMMGLE